MKPNMIFVTVDALRADYIYEHDGKIHPFMSSLMKKSVVFKDAYSPSYGTDPAFKGLFSDFFPNEDCPQKRPFFNIPEDANYIAELFKQKGYYTMGFSTNPHLTRLHGYDRGYDYFYDGLKEEQGSSKNKGKWLDKIKAKLLTKIKDNFDIKLKHGKRIIGPIMAMAFVRGYETSRSIIKRIKKKVSETETDKPLFIWMHMMEVHSPFGLSEELFKKIGEKKIPLWEVQWLRHLRYNYWKVEESGLSNKDMEKIKVLYKCGIREVDDLLMDLFNFIDNNKNKRKNIFAITSDHGEFLGEHGLLSHKPYPFKSVLQVPLIIYNGGKENGEIDDVFGNTNLMDVLLDSTEGRSIIDTGKKHSGIAISEGHRHRVEEIFSAADKDYRIIWNNYTKEKDVYEIHKGREKKLRELENKDYEYLESILFEHIRNVKDVEKSKIQKAVKIGKLDINKDRKI